MGYAMENNKKICCVFGHRRIKNKEKIISLLFKTIENLILNENVYVFLFGSQSEFDELCYDVVSDLIKKYPLCRVYVRAEYPYISKRHEIFLLQNYYEKTYYPERLLKAGKNAYTERNLEMIDKADICLVYYKTDRQIIPDHKLNSITGFSYEYAFNNKKRIVNIQDEM